MPKRDIPGHGHILMSHSAMPFATFMGISSETTLIGATECRGCGDCCCSALASLPACQREGVGLPQTAMGCPRWPRAAPDGHGLPKDVVGRVTAWQPLSREFPLQRRADLRHIRARGQGQPGLTVTQGWGHSVTQVLAQLPHSPRSAACAPCPPSREEAPQTPHPQQCESDASALPNTFTFPSQTELWGWGSSTRANVYNRNCAFSFSHRSTSIVQSTNKDKVKLLQRLYPSPPLQLQKSFHKN